MDDAWQHAWNDRGGDDSPLEKLSDEALDTFIALAGEPTDQAAADVRDALLEWCYGSGGGALESSRVERLCDAFCVVLELEDGARPPAGSPNPSDEWIAREAPTGAERLTEPREPVDVSDAPEGGGFDTLEAPVSAYLVAPDALPEAIDGDEIG
jgi:hypothetical protein